MSKEFIFACNHDWDLIDTDEYISDDKGKVFYSLWKCKKCDYNKEEKLY